MSFLHAILWRLRACLQRVPVAILVGLTSGLPLARAAPGDLDPSFGTGGYVGVEVVTHGYDEAWGVAMQPDRKLVIAGSASPPGGAGDYVLVRLNPDGSMDSTFGRAGRVATDFGSHNMESAKAVVIQKDGKLVVAGFVNDQLVALARYRSNGVLDSTFGGGGRVRTTIPSGFDRKAALLMQNDGKFIVAGGGAFALERYDSSGHLDATFGTDGHVDLGIGGGVFALAQGFGKIVAAGTDASGSLAVARLDLSGAIDLTFGGVGFVLTDFRPNATDYANAVVVQKDQKIVVAGTRGMGTAIDETEDFALVRYMPDGALDSRFGNGGKVFADIKSRRLSNQATGLALQTDGKLLVAGPSDNVGTSDFAILRYTKDGVRDLPFGKAGMILSDFRGDDRPSALLLQPDGRLVVVGSSDGDFTVARYEAARPLDRCQGRVAAIVGTAGNDIIYGTSRNDVIAALAGNDRVYGRAGADIICGGAGTDSLYGESGKDTCDGGTGSDRASQCERLISVP